MNTILAYLKAIAGFVAPGAVLVGAAVLESSPAGERITQAEWVTAVVACIVSAAAVAVVPNRDPRGLRQGESVQPPSAR